jgi:hypothetical protein
MQAREAFESIRVKKDGPIKKFELLKLFGRALKESGIADPRTMSCADLEAKIAEIIDSVELRSAGDAIDLGTSRSPYAFGRFAMEFGASLGTDSGRRAKYPTFRQLNRNILR